MSVEEMRRYYQGQSEQIEQNDNEQLTRVVTMRPEELEQYNPRQAAMAAMIPETVQQRNALMLSRVEQRNQLTERSIRAADGEPSQDQVPADETRKQKKERREKEKKAREGGCFQATAKAVDLQEMALNRHARIIAERADMSEAFANEDLATRYLYVDSLRSKVLNYAVDERVFETDHVSMAYIRENLDSVLTMREQVRMLREMRKDKDYGPYFEQMSQKATEKLDLQMELFEAFYEGFREQCADYGVDISTGNFLRQNLQRDDARKNARKEVLTRAKNAYRAQEAADRRELEEQARQQSEIVHELTEEQTQRHGHCNEHVYMNQEEAQRVVENSDQFLYARRVEANLYEVRATLPETVKVNGRDIPLRRTYNQMIKAILGGVFKQDGDKMVLRGYDELTDVPLTQSLRRSLERKNDGQPLTRQNMTVQEFLDSISELNTGQMQMEDARRIFEPIMGSGERLDAFLGNLMPLINKCLDGGTPFVPTETVGSLQSTIQKIEKAKAGDDTLDERIQLIRAQTELDPEIREAQERAAREISERSAAAEAEMAELLRMSDDEIDVPLPNTCSASARLMAGLRQAVAPDSEIQGTWYYTGINHQVQTNQLYYAVKCLEHQDRFEKKPELVKRSKMSILRYVAAMDPTLVSPAVFGRMHDWLAELESQEEETQQEEEQQEETQGVVLGEAQQEKAQQTEEERQRAQAERQRAEAERQRKEALNAQREEDLKAVLAQMTQGYLRDHATVDLFSREEADQFCDQLKEFVNFEEHHIAPVSVTEDGDIVTSECFAAETREYVKPAFTRKGKAIGVYHGRKYGQEEAEQDTQQQNAQQQDTQQQAAQQQDTQQQAAQQQDTQQQAAQQQDTQQQNTQEDESQARRRQIREAMDNAQENAFLYYDLDSPVETRADNVVATQNKNVFSGKKEEQHLPGEDLLETRRMIQRVQEAALEWERQEQAGGASAN